MTVCNIDIYIIYKIKKNNILIHIGIVQLILSWTKPNMIKWVGDTDQYVQHISVYYHLFLVKMLDICVMFSTCFFQQNPHTTYWISKQKHQLINLLTVKPVINAFPSDLRDWYIYPHMNGWFWWDQFVGKYTVRPMDSIQRLFGRGPTTQ